ncbi:MULTISPECIES: sigma-70 family RNA polymerase sigma factor [Paenibacillus]|uniref:sigma-70 family RNA polymerase sigma factor n=1 Tax=Paenibacillus TaxID=44249 RepID=UPI0007E4C616|nr:sigma-70 family RNA polymerase sigma factor [Paenibacillus sp. AD87]OAX50805.1 RNA polymerase sigma factor SigO [Paenibacillus sp. AD87]
MLQENKVDQPGISEEEKRFIGYISSMLHYNSIHFDKKIRKITERYALVLDDIDVKDEAMEESDTESISEPLEEQISDPSLYAAFLSLTTREREVVNLSICRLLRDTEIAHVLGVSQQSVSKTRKKALEKLRKAIIKNGGVGYG